ncbi:MAG: hypothetical protein WCC71_09650, partial [Candidatus Sulfotelmatobacter sp.]
VLLDPLNSTQTTALANLDTLGSLIAAFATVANDNWRTRFFKASTPTGGATPTNTLEALAGIAREPWTSAKELYALFDEAYPQPKDGSRRAAPFVPYLAYVPDDFALSLCFAGGGVYSPGRLMFDAEGNLWSGQNWMAGSQSGVNTSIGGGVVKMSPNGTALSPPITGFSGMGIDGVGWGTAVTSDRVWTTSFNGKILVMDFISNEVGRCQEFSSSFFEFLHLFCESLHLFHLDRAHPCACAGTSLRWTILLPSSISTLCPPYALSPVTSSLGAAHQTSLRS